MTLVWKSGLNLQSPASNDPLLDLNTQPSLDLQFATGKTLDDRVSGFPLVNHQRDASSGKSAGTYVGSDGLIKTSPVNLLTYSDTLSGWSLSNATRAVSSTNPPFGSGNASSFTATGVSTVYPFGGLASNSPSGTYTFTIYTTFTQSFSFLGYGSGFGLLVLFDVDTKQPSTVTLNSGTNATNINSSVTSEEGGWYKIQVTFTTTGVVSEATVALNKNKATAWGLSNSSVVGDTLALFGAQLEEGSTASTYIPTTTTISGAPRFDHDPVTGESLGLLIEESRTNLLTYSSNHQQDTTHNFLNGYTSTVHTKVTNIDPPVEGDEVWIIENQGSNDYAIKSDDSTQSGYVSYTIFLKRYDSDTVNIRSHFGNTVGTFNLVNGTFTNGDYGVQMLPYSNGWYKIIWTRDYSSQSRQTGITIAPNSSTGVYVSGIQIEVGSFPTSYIPTSGTTVTRAADVASITGSNFSSWYNSTAGSFYADVKAYGTSTGSSRIIGTDQIATPLYYNTTADTIQSYGNTVGPTVSGLIAFGRHKAGMAYATGDEAISVNGGTVVTSAVGFNNTSNTVTAVALFDVTSGSEKTTGHIARLTYYPYRLADATLQEITS